MNRHDVVGMVTSEKAPWELQEVEVTGASQKWFVNGPQSLRQLYEDNLSDEPFYAYEDECYTFHEIYRMAASLAQQLQSRYGVKHGDRVAIAMRNYPEWPIALEAITSIGAIAVAINAWWLPEEIDYAFKLTGVTVVIADQERIERISHIAPESTPDIIAVRAAPSDSTTPIETLTSSNDPMPSVGIHPDDNAVILFTSGSTGHPKGSVSTHRNILAALLSWEVDFVTQFIMENGEFDQEKIGSAAKSQSTALLAMPLFHVNGLHAVLLAAFRMQRKIISMYKWDAATAADIIDKEGISIFVGTPAMTGDLVEYAKRSHRNLESLRSTGGGGSARATSQVKDIGQSLKNAAPFTGWGMTETNSIGTGIYGADYLKNPKSSGMCSAVLEISTIDEQGSFLPPGDRGELVVRGTSVIHGYWNQPQANTESFVGEWFRTGDVAYINDGHLYVVDRIKQLIIRGGENIGCGEVEDALLDHPEVIEASVYGVPDDRLGETVAATLYINADAKKVAISDYLHSRLAKFKVPEYLKLCTKQLPRIASGKIDKRRLRQEHIGDLGLPFDSHQ
ncbi:class I adenylate-forming enzyme family protein [Pseudohalioglobus lutimaris]|uniref:Fatty acid--CoA ligase n=1 Tax=Pseudohalioglobus lutimaris TaxID=1737061 RepID=A0A2N5X032_9GAMM|nr:class I adenylate-forming enzyme family protein [Pseudohalioglobus lutimaris]PLW67841.1 fatty acid--CoA ligase [Pseudohalioglobus lutimaris]